METVRINEPLNCWEAPKPYEPQREDERSLGAMVGRFNDYCGAGRDKRPEVGAPKPHKCGMVKI